MKIKYKAYTQNGEKVSGILDTESEQIAYNILEKKQLLPYHIEEIENISHSMKGLARGLYQTSRFLLFNNKRK